jgi:glycosyltransferase involved in cell wall biosynthesis
VKENFRKLNVVHVCTSIDGGAGRAAYRLHESLLEYDYVHSSLLYLSGENEKRLENCYVYSAREFSFMLRLANKCRNMLSRFSIFDKRSKIINNYENVLPKLSCELASLPYGLPLLPHHKILGSADIVNLHWVCGMLDYPTFFSRCSSPVVWTLHDMNPFKGLFHYEGDEISNAPQAALLDKEVAEVKMKAISTFSKEIALVTPSQWMATKAAKSAIFSDKYVEVIANTLDLGEFDYIPDNNIREQFGIDSSRTVLLFVAQKVNNRRKGLDLLFQALKACADLPLTLIAIGSGSLPDQIEGIDVKVAGSVNSDMELARFYSGVDGFILPSREDNLPNVMLEAFGCGTPVLAFPVGGMKEHVREDKTGILAAEVTYASLADAIRNFCSQKHSFNRNFIRTYALELFNSKLHAERYLQLYQRLAKPKF